MSAAGKVCTGFSKPYVALYSHDGTTITYTSGRVLARGVDVSIEPETSDDNAFYADNVQAENDAGTFTGGTLNLTVDGLLQEAEKLIMGLPTPDAKGWMSYGNKQKVPEVGVGFIARYVSGGDVSYVPTVMPRVIFDQIQSSHATSEDSINYQTQALSARILRADDADQNWKHIGQDCDTEEDAEGALKERLGITGA